MKKWPLMFVVSLLLASGCGGVRQDEFLGRRALSEEEVRIRRSDIIERLAPEDGGINRRTLGALVEAVLTVRKDLKPREVPEEINGVRQILRETSLRDLEKIERILPELVKNR